jgi:Uma2 family endonuclease
MVTLQLRQLMVYPGQRVQFQDVLWPEFEAILDELGEKRASRIAYSDGVLEIRMPLPEHEKAKVLIGDMVKIILEELDIDNECFGSTTFKNQDMARGIEPDDCFYIEHAGEMIGKNRIDLAIDPPPDLAIEVDITSKTGLDAYQGLGVPELWQFEDGRLRISLLEHGQYCQVSISPHFPELAVIDLISEFIQRAQTDGRSSALKAFRHSMRTWVLSH